MTDNLIIKITPNDVIVNAGEYDIELTYEQACDVLHRARWGVREYVLSDIWSMIEDYWNDVLGARRTPR